jgi:ankyrin repeat protein
LRDNFGKTGLHYAASGGAQIARLVVVQILLERGANVVAKDDDGMTPLYLVAENGNEAVVKLLVEKGVDIGAKDNSR